MPMRALASVYLLKTYRARPTAKGTPNQSADKSAHSNHFATSFLTYKSKSTPGRSPKLPSLLPELTRT